MEVSFRPNGSQSIQVTFGFLKVGLALSAGIEAQPRSRESRLCGKFADIQIGMLTEKGLKVQFEAQGRAMKG